MENIWESQAQMEAGGWHEEVGPELGNHRLSSTLTFR